MVDQVLRNGFSPEEIARRNGVSLRHLHNLWHRGEGPRRVRLGRRVVITAAAEAEWLENLAETLPEHRAA